MNMGAPSHEVAEIAMAITANVDAPTAIDLGAGAGRNSLLLGELGFSVVAVEQNPALLEELTRQASDQQLTVSTHCTEVENYRFQNTHDLCLLLGILHFLTEKDALRVVQEAKSTATTNAIHVVTISDSALGSTEMENSLPAQGFLASLQTSDVLNAYDDWELLALEKYVKIDSHRENEVDEHPISKMVFGKTGRATRLVRSKSSCLRIRPDQPRIHEKMRGFRIRSARCLELCNTLGEPDFDFKVRLPGKQNTLIEGTAECTLRACFWGNAKAYFENDILVGVGFYQSDGHWRFEPQVIYT